MVLTSFTRFYWVLLRNNQFYWDWMRFTGFYWIFPGFTGIYYVLVGSTTSYWIIPSFTEFYWVWTGFTMFYWVLMDFTEFSWVSLGLTRIYWVLLCISGSPRVLLRFVEFGLYETWLGFIDWLDSIDKSSSFVMNRRVESENKTQSNRINIILKKKIGLGNCGVACNERKLGTTRPLKFSKNPIFTRRFQWIRNETLFYCYDPESFGRNVDFWSKKKRNEKWRRFTKHGKSNKSSSFFFQIQKKFKIFRKKPLETKWEPSTVWKEILFFFFVPFVFLFVFVFFLFLLWRERIFIFIFSFYGPLGSIESSSLRGDTNSRRSEQLKANFPRMVRRRAAFSPFIP